MKVSQSSIGRIFTIRLEDNEKLPDTLENFAHSRGIKRGFCLFVGGVNDGGKVVVGPEDGSKSPPVPMVTTLVGVHEVSAVGTLFPDEEGYPRLHAHAAMGRKGSTIIGCIRQGISAWKTLEIILIELQSSSGQRVYDPSTGFHLLELGRE